MGYSGFYWVLLDLDGVMMVDVVLYRVLLCFSRLFTGLYWVLRSFIEFSWVLLDFTGFY